MCRSVFKEMPQRSKYIAHIGFTAGLPSSVKADFASHVLQSVIVCDSSTTSLLKLRYARWAQELFQGMKCWIFLLQALFQISAVCRAWRRASKRIFFSRPWDSCTTLCHPLQLFSTVRPTAHLNFLTRPVCKLREDNASVHGLYIACFLRTCIHGACTVVDSYYAG